MNDRVALETRAGRRVLVTGDAGFLGSYVCERLVMEGASVTRSTRPARGPRTMCQTGGSRRGRCRRPSSRNDRRSPAAGRPLPTGATARPRVRAGRQRVSRAVPACADARRRASAARRTAGCIRG
ncbi:NAD-dependent epimerase/dehydratase family protein [Burkholderia cepacia]|uniref:NAD-dependent epimerase/dehydratase family protein n=1 Tax=Burkholderia cepacia TaxID=292 RepID=UPI00398E89B8